MASFIALDFEGTGLIKPETEDPHAQPGIVEIGMVKVVFGAKGFKSPPEEFSELIDPETMFEEKAQEITGITPEQLRGKPNLREKFREMADFCLGVEHLVTFNGNSYDIPLLQYNLRRYNLETRFPWPPVQHDLMEISMRVLNLQGKTGNKPPNLMLLYETLHGKEYDGAHRAVNDAFATAECAKSLYGQGYLRL